MLILSVLHYVWNFINTLLHIERDAEKFHRREMHGKFDMICIYLEESAITGEIIHDDIHHGRKCVK